MRDDQAALHPDLVSAALKQEPRSYLFFGFTTVVDLIGTRERTSRWNALDIRPDALFCGAVAVGGGNAYRVPFPAFSYDQSKRIDLTPLTINEAVSQIADEGAVCIKTFYDTDFPTSIEEARALVAAAHERGLRVFVHANRKDGQAFALAAGMDVIAHGMWRDRSEDPALDDASTEILASISRQGIGYQPTTQVMVGLLDMRDDHYLARRELADAYPAELIDWYATDEGRWFSNRMKANAPDGDTVVRGTLGRAAEVTRILAQSDAHLLFGSDTPSDVVFTNPPGLNGRLEMNNWVAAGVSEEKLFRALTIDNARMLGLDAEIGTIEPGKRANLVLLRANPLLAVDAYDTIETVFLNGQPIARERLSALKAGDVTPH